MVKTVQKPKWFTSERHKEAVSHVEAVLYEYPENNYSYTEFVKPVAVLKDRTFFNGNGLYTTVPGSQNHYFLSLKDVHP